jgi:hypothetical protein
LSYPVYGVARVDGTLHYLADTYVTGYHSFCGISDYFTDADIYSGKQFHLNNQLDDCLVPYIRSSKYDACAYKLLLKYQASGW